MNKKKFDVVLTNPPYSDGNRGGKLLYPQFFKKSLELADVVASVMPVDLDTNHMKLKAHNKLIRTHLVELGPNVNEHFNVSAGNIHCVIADTKVTNDPNAILEEEDNLYPERERLKPILGSVKVGNAKPVKDGLPIIHKVYKGDKIIIKNITDTYVKLSKKKSNAPYLVVVNYIPVKGRFNAKVLEHTNKELTWGHHIYVFEAQSKEEAEKLHSWLICDEIVEEIIKILKTSGKWNISKKMIEKLPWYE